MDTEFNALIRNDTWTLVSPHPQMNIVGCKWVYIIKRLTDGSIERYKAHLVAKGFHQQEGLDYSETIPNHVCRLHKSLYGLKQAPRAWFDRFSEFLTEFGFLGSKTNTSLFTYNTAAITMYLLVYVDDIVLTGNNTLFMSRFLDQLTKTFTIKDLDNLHYFLGISAHSCSKGLMLSQWQYILDLLDRTHMTSCKPISTPLSPSQSLSRLGGTPVDDPTLYHSVVGGLQYASLTRPDISFAVNKVCQFMHRPCTDHWAAVKRILRYLKSTIDHGLYLQRQPTLQLSAYFDADSAGCPDDKKSMGGFAIYHGTNLISWSSRKQATMARSSTELEYRAIANAAAELT
ncbi:uncharacterized mitochondrial protein AtMg00810-like [Telopea speciosissima]|uniref:uncharacterized mitochondrial protein AtMg00810-like n=1 Tax=Telopea speciosissima TaxID=54955 RepID=UPI001CC61F92|nr:uncharacterized mitochondrial protein AtMg00810-like [Telopea speciosissima]